jgi:hypothetical protein
MSFDILNRWTQAVIYHSDTAVALAAALKDAVASEANLSGADLSGADLSMADLRWADLRGADLSEADLRMADLRMANLRGADLSRANLSGANLSEANLSEANLSGADLSGADLSRANLSGANLREADLSEANLSEANLSGANLRGANLSGADLSGADLTPIRDDFWSVLAATPHEIPALRLAITEGRVDGSTYSGDCPCLVGTIANARHCAYDAIAELRPNSSRPAERFFLGIPKGATPADNQFSALALAWLDEFDARMREVYGAKS